VLQSLLEHWSGLTLFVEHPEVPMDNNRGENSIRNPVTGNPLSITNHLGHTTTMEYDTRGLVKKMTAPNGLVILILQEGTLVQVLPETQTVEGVVWLHVIIPDGRDGWMWASLLALAALPTPTP